MLDATIIGGEVHDGDGGAPVRADAGITGERSARIRPPAPGEPAEARALAAEKMADGALGIASALIYPHGSYADTDELTALCQVVAGYGGCYASHIRGEGEDLLNALGEFLAICRAAVLRGEVFHLLREGYFADVVVFDPATVADKATFAGPHQCAVSVREVLVTRPRYQQDRARFRLAPAGCPARQPADPVAG